MNIRAFTNNVSKTKADLFKITLRPFFLKKNGVLMKRILLLINLGDEKISSEIPI